MQAVVCPVDHHGRFTAEADELAPAAGTALHAPLAGLSVLTAGNAAVLDALSTSGRLLHMHDYAHKYPYDWRTKKPVIVRATQQWFARLGQGVHDAAQTAAARVQYVPAAGRARLQSFIGGRDLWCISRQRAWGVPIPVFFEQTTGEALITRETVLHVAALVAQHGTDVWWQWPVEKLLPAEVAADGKTYVKGTDTLDVWFDSGSSWAAVLRARGLPLPADVYLEGSDQHRGWFQSSLQTAAAMGEAAPYRTLVTHGFVLDPHKQKMSKSVGNVVDPDVVIHGGKDKKRQPAYGVDVLRLWVASTDHTRDVVLGPDLVKDAATSLRAIRNTARFILGVLGDFDPANDAVPLAQLPPSDGYVLTAAAALLREADAGYHSYRLRPVLTAALHFATQELSSFYCDVSKDRLYNDARDGPQGRAVRTALWLCLRALMQTVAPIVPHTAEDVFLHLPPACRAAMRPCVFPTAPCIR